MSRFVVISGCSGGGKSSLLSELAARGYPVVEEPGRRVVVEETARHGSALPWVDLPAFLRRVIAMARADLHAADASANWVFFDRGLIDAFVALQHVSGKPVLAPLVDRVRPYHRLVFLTPPWPEIYVQDAERRHDFNSATAEYARLLEAYPALGYDVRIVPKASIAERADIVLKDLQG
jgi:predicted ATPase